MIEFNRIKSINGEIVVPPDKSITHRAFLLALMAEGKSLIKNPLESRDTLSTLNAVCKLGANAEKKENGYAISSKGYEKVIEPRDIIDCENSGTTVRLITGILAPRKKFFVLTGDDSLKKRPMDRVITPLSELNARIYGRNNNKLLPICILPSEMSGGNLEARVKSAQVKSAVLLAAAQIRDISTYYEKVPTRNHTELMLQQFGCNITSEKGSTTISGGIGLKAADIFVPGDFSSAAFFVAAALIFENSEIILKNVGLNKTRTGMLDVLKKFGVNFETDVKNSRTGESYGDIYIKNQPFKGGIISGDIIANIIDECPVLAALGLFAETPVEIREAGELRIKETDRIKAMVYNLKSLGARVDEFEDGLKVYPLEKVKTDCTLKSFDDHRIAMINILLAKRFGNIPIDDISSVDVSFPDFLSNIENIEVNY